MAFEIPESEPSPQELTDEISATADNAVEWIRSMSGIELDFSPPSLMVLDRIMPELVQSLAPDDREATIFLLGSYLGEVLLREFGGRWETADAFAGPGLHGLGARELTVSPFARVRKAFGELEQSHFAEFWNEVVHGIGESDELNDADGFRKPRTGEFKLLPTSPGAVIPGEDAPSDEELADSIASETTKFIELIRSDLGIELDFSIDSLRFLDHYLKSLSEKITEMKEMGERRVFVYLAGNYLGEVLKRAYGGKWIYVPEEQTSGLIVSKAGKSTTVFPHKVAAELAMAYRSGGAMTFADKVKRMLDNL